MPSGIASLLPAAIPDLIGCDFSSRPSKKKPIVVARGACSGATVRVSDLLRFESLEPFGQWLQRPGRWVGGFDFPFGLPRELVLAMGWPTSWEPCMRHYASLTRQDIRGRFAAFCDARPAGAKFAHRQTDGPAGSSPSMRWVNPPVAYMMHAGVPLLLDAGVVLPGLWDGNGRTAGVEGHLDRVALEAYPGLLAREIVGRQSYKNDDSARQDIPRRQARGRIVAALEGGHNSLAQTLELPPALRSAMLRDGSGDCLDAVLCLMQAAWAWRQGWPRYGVPPGIDPLEGWILTAPASAHAV